VIWIIKFPEEVAVSGLGFIVPKDSAHLKQYPIRSIHANHMDMTKFNSNEDPGYTAVRTQLSAWIGDRDKGDPAGVLELTTFTHPERHESTRPEGTASTHPESIGPTGTTSNTCNVKMYSQGGSQFQGGNVSGNTFSWGK